jgi:hypothetical protein
MGGNTSEAVILEGEVLSGEYRMAYFVGMSRLTRPTKG